MLEKTAMSKIQLSVIVVLYLFFLNVFSNQSIDKMLSAIWPALILLVFFLIVSLFHRVILKIFLSFNILITSIAVFAKWSYGITISEDILLAALINETDLTAEMVSLNFLLWIIATGLFPIGIISFIKIKKQTFSKQFIHTFIFIMTLFLTAGAIFISQGYEFRAAGHIRDPRFATDLTNFSPLDSEYNFKKALKAYKKLEKVYKNVEIMSKKYHYQTNVDDLLVVFIIGETSRGDHFGINGYTRNTTPLLSTVNNLYSFKNAESCDTSTKLSLDCLSSPMTKRQSDRMIRESSFGEIFKSLGYHTEIYSLQTLSDFYNYLKYDKLVTKYAILNTQQTGAKDISLLPYVKKSIGEYKNGKKLLIFHTLGSHQTYADRVMPNQAIFTPYCTNPDVSACKQQELVNAFDNSIVAVDSFVYSVIKELSNKKAILIYLSDHGESLGENGNFFHGKPVNIAPKEQFSIPFIIWLSDKYLATSDGKEYAKNIQKHFTGNTQVSHDNLFHSLIGCSGIQSSDGGIDEALNICH